MNSLEFVENALEELIIEFKERRDYFFSERDIHAVFYCKLTSLGDLIHPEYPTRKRFIRIRGKKTDERYTEGVHCFEPSANTGRRGHYDFAVLNQEFFNKYQDNFEKLSSTSVETNKDLKDHYIDIAIEFKYITGTFDPREIEYDLFKLKQASEVKNKKLIIFTRRRPTDKNYDGMIQSLYKIKEDEPELHIEIIVDSLTLD